MTIVLFLICNRIPTRWPAAPTQPEPRRGLTAGERVASRGSVRPLLVLLVWLHWVDWLQKSFESVRVFVTIHTNLHCNHEVFRRITDMCEIQRIALKECGRPATDCGCAWTIRAFDSGAQEHAISLQQVRAHVANRGSVKAAGTLFNLTIVLHAVSDVQRACTSHSLRNFLTARGLPAARWISSYFLTRRVIGAGRFVGQWEATSWHRPVGHHITRSNNGLSCHPRWQDIPSCS